MKSFFEYYNTILEFLIKNGKSKRSDIINYCAKIDGISDKDRNKTYLRSNNIRVFDDRVNWLLHG